ncbi:hypothetical protein TH63_18595 [Rufibacter radiotolerans]|uniref:Uncharacterized protein n=1 Tax=Rufibacter radiotolerans TaxID=1379910 RepID=A0A0H4VPH0_9BACT|nr:hypothetical protein TH63_18595 [Rufibacter radiotolerans]
MYFSSFGNWKNRYVRTVFNAFLESYNTVCQSKQGVVFPDAYVSTWVVSSTALTHDNVTSDDGLATENFHA